MSSFYTCQTSSGGGGKGGFLLFPSGCLFPAVPGHVGAPEGLPSWTTLKHSGSVGEWGIGEEEGMCGRREFGRGIREGEWETV